ncbi:MAG TPA: hypothetical protein VNN22_07180 [Verrucomicrobiae bacterium]|nr:hypothetical protein [Verrucomicrobiae bacterium]
MKTIFTHRYVASFLAAAALLLMTGCNTVSISSNQFIGGPIYAPTNPASVEILRTPPSRPHVRLGEVTAEPSSDSVSVQQIEAALQKAAAKMGANAVVIVYDRTQVTGAFINGPWYGRSIQETRGRVIIGVAIRYTGN